MSEGSQPPPSAPQPDGPSGPAGMPRWVIGALLGGAVVIIGLLVAVVVLLTGGGSSSDNTAKDPGETTSAKPKTFVVNGDITLIDSGVRWDTTGTCYGTEGYDDMHGGTQVVIKDAGGTTIAVGQLNNGAKENSVTCRFDFTVDGVPSGGAAYSLEISHRGSYSFTEDTAIGIHLSLG